MQESNPYQPPQSRVEDRFGTTSAAPMTLKQLWFSFEGRVSRQSFWLKGLLLAGLVYGVMVGIVTAVSAATQSVLWLVVLVPLYIGMLWTSFAIYAKRWHDRDKSGWWSLLSLIPVVGLWTIIECGFLKGSAGDNRFGADPLS